MRQQNIISKMKVKLGVSKLKIQTKKYWLYVPRWSQNREEKTKSTILKWLKTDKNPQSLTLHTLILLTPKT